MIDFTRGAWRTDTDYNTIEYTIGTDPGSQDYIIRRWFTPNGTVEDWIEPTNSLELKTKEDVFVFIVECIKSNTLYEPVDGIFKRIKNKLEKRKEEIEEHFDNCVFICDKRNNKEDNSVIVDFHFTEKDINVRRNYKFVLDIQRSIVDVIEL